MLSNLRNVIGVAAAASLIWWNLRVLRRGMSINKCPQRHVDGPTMGVRLSIDRDSESGTLGAEKLDEFGRMG